MAAVLPLHDLDTLRELASIGCGRAVSALGRFTQRTGDMAVPELRKVRSAADLRDLVAAPDESVLAVGVGLEGFLGGHLVLALPERDARRIAALLGQPVRDAGWEALSESALLESGNIAGSAFVSAVGALTGAKLMLSVPRLARGAGQDCLGQLVGSAPLGLALATRFELRGREPVHGRIVVFPDPQRIPDLLAALPGP